MLLNKNTIFFNARDASYRLEPGVSLTPSVRELLMQRKSRLKELGEELGLQAEAQQAIEHLDRVLVSSSQ